MKKVVKCIFILILTLFIMLLFSNFAKTEAAGWEEDIQKTQINDGGKINSAMEITIGVVQAVGIGVAVIMIVIVGGKYIIAAPTEKANIKKQTLIYLIGAVLIFSASVVLRIVIVAVNEII